MNDAAPRRSHAARAVQALERGTDRIFGADANPLRQLRALAFLMLWIALASGTYMYIVFDTSAAGAYASIALPCSAMLPPSFAEFALRDGASRVIVASCGTSACAHRLGGRWRAERLADQREPYLRARVRGPHVQLADELRGDELRLRTALRHSRMAPATVSERTHA